MITKEKIHTRDSIAPAEFLKFPLAFQRIS